jgi:sec-independent protein translocase protein TatC
MVIGPQHTGNSNYGFATYFFSDYAIIFGPVRNIYPINFFVTYQSLGLTDSFCITEFPYHPEYLHGGTGKCVYLVCLAGFILSFPYFYGKYGNL